MHLLRRTYVLALLVLATAASTLAQHKRTKQAKDTTRFIGKDEYIDVQVEPKMLVPPYPEYPALAKKKKLKGRAYISVLIDTDGTVAQCVADNVSNPIFREPALKAAKKARFSPAIQNGKPVKIWWTLAIYFPPEHITARIAETTTKSAHAIRTLLVPDPVTRTEIAFQSVGHDGADQPNEPILVDSFYRYVYYPEDAKRKGLEGSVSLKILLDRSGNKKQIEVISATDSIFIRPALDAMTHARFASPTFYNQSDTATAYQRVVFRLDHALDHPAAHSFPNMPEIRVAENNVSTPVARFDVEDLLEYPKEAKDQGLQGTVNVSAEINEHGIVLQTVVEDSTNPIFNSAAQTAVEHMLFEPARNAGGPIKTWWTVPVVFRLKPSTH